VIQIVSLSILALASSPPSPTIAQQTQLHGRYMGQDPPGETPLVFAPGVVSTDRRELNSVFTPDGNEFYFSYSQGGGSYTIMVMRQVDGRWTEPEAASFNGEYSNVDMALSHDGRQIFFGTNRPPSGTGQPPGGFDIWVAEREGSRWGEPRTLGEIVNGGEHQIYPTAARDGTLYFQARRPEGYGGSDVYRSALIDGAYRIPENLGPAINSEHNEGDVLIAPDQSFMVVSVSGRADSLGSGDLYVSFRGADGTWTPLENMGAPINTESLEYCPMLSPDGRYLFFTSARSGTGDIYWVDASVIEALR